MSVNQDDVLLRLSYLLGEQSVPTTGIDDRKQFIQDALERTFRQYNFESNKSIATMSLTNGIGNLPSDISFTPDLDIRVINPGTNDDYVFTRVPYEEQDNFSKGDYAYWTLGSAGAYTFNSKETDLTAVTVRYTSEAPTINASVSTTFPSAMVLARGALVYFRQSENPQADVSQDEALYQEELQEVIGHEIRNRPLRRAVTIQEATGHYSGEV